MFDISETLFNCLTDSDCLRWLSNAEASEKLPRNIPGSVSLSTRAGLLFNELQFAPEAVLFSILRLLRFVIEQDPGRPETPREGVILFIIRLAVRVESYGKLVLAQHHRVGKRQIEAKQEILEQIRKGVEEISRVLQEEILQMLLEWASQVPCLDWKHMKHGSTMLDPF